MNAQNTSRSNQTNNAPIFDQMARYHSADPAIKAQAISEIVEDHRKFVSKIINRTFSTYKQNYWEDMFQAGIVGLISSLEKYDPQKSKPTTFFNFYILHEINDFVSRYVHRVTSHHASKIRDVVQAERALEKRGVEEPTAEDIAVEMNVKVEAVIKVKQYQTLSQPQSFESEAYMDSMMIPDHNPDEASEREERIKVIEDAIMRLKHEPREVVIRKRGLLGHEVQTNQEISNETGIPLDRIRQYYQTAIRELRKDPQMNAFFPDFTKETKREIDKMQISITPKKAAVNAMTELVDFRDNEVANLEL